jgi:hypothetical protein
MLRKPDEDGAIFLIEPEKINEVNPLVGRASIVSLSDEDPKTSSTSSSELYHPGVAIEDLPKDKQPPLTPMAVSPTLTNARMRAQRARFVICGDDFTPLERNLKDAITKISLPASMYTESVEWLELIGMSAFMLFPDLEGVRRDFEEKTEKVRKVVREIQATRSDQSI